MANNKNCLKSFSTSVLAMAIALSASLAIAIDTALDPVNSGLSMPYGSQVQAIGKGASARDEENGEDGEDDSLAFLYPAVSIGITHDDNLYREESDEKASGTIYRLRPSLTIQGAHNTTRMIAGYVGNYAKYSDSPRGELDDYTDHKLFAGISGYGSKTFYDLMFDYTRGHDSISGNGLDDNLEAYDVWNRYALAGSLTYGRPDARLNLRIDGELTKQEQDDLKSIDLNTQGLGAQLGVRVGGKTRAVLEGGLRRYDYVNSTQSGDRYYARIGATWEATEKTTGIVTYGREKFNADNPGTPLESDEFGPAFGTNEDTSNSTWRGDIHWEIRTRDTLRLFTYKGTRVSSGTGSNKVSTQYGIDWKHDWSERVRSNLGYLGATEDYTGIVRSDDLISYYLFVSYKFRRNILLRGDYNYSERDSNIEGYDYDSNRYSLFLDWEL